MKYQVTMLERGMMRIESGAVSREIWFGEVEVIVDKESGEPRFFYREDGEVSELIPAQGK